MTREQLISLLYYKVGRYQRKVVVDAVDVILKEILDGIQEGKRVEIRRFGFFYRKDRGAKMIRHPRTKRLMKTMPCTVMRYSYSDKALENI